MMRLGAGLALLIAVSVGGATPNAPLAPPRYKVVHGWPTLPEGRILGQATGVGVDSRGNVWVFHRAGREWSEPMPADAIAGATVAVFDGTSGKLLREWGAGQFVMPHGLTIDHQDNVWLTDVGTHQLFKYSAAGKLILTLGEARVPGVGASHFNLPTDVAVLPDGSFYVSDGYANTRVVKYSARGDYQFEWGKPGKGPGEFDLPHAIALDRQGRVYVADRSNARVQIFSPQGKFLMQWAGQHLGRPYSVALGRTGEAIIVDGGDQPSGGRDRSGAAVVSLAGRLLARFGRFGNQDGQFRLAHDVAADRTGNIYIVDAWGQRVQKFAPAQLASRR